MLSLKDIEEASFRKAGMKGYHTGDVDEFLDEVKESYEKLLNDNNVLKAKLSEALEKNRVMTSDLTAMRTKMDVYRTDGDEIKHALISAHKTADATIREAKNRANEIIAAAKKTADDELGGLDAKIKAKELELETMKQAVTDFRTRIFAMYKEHLAMIDQIPVYAQNTAQNTTEAPKPIAKKVVKQEEPEVVEPLEPVQVVETPEVIQPEEVEKPAPVEKSAPASKDSDVFDFSNFIVDSDDFQPQHKHRKDLKFGDDYDISKDK